MKKLTFLSLLLLFWGIANATVDCRPMSLVTAGDNGMVINLPTSPSCLSPTYTVSARVYGSGLPFAPVSVTVTSPSPGSFQGAITGLEPCTSYEILVLVYCGGSIEGGCVNAVPFTTTGCDPCRGCLDFLGIEIIGQRECEAELLMDWTRLEGCGEITIISQTWDFGHAGGTGSGELITHTFPGNGTYTVTATIVYSVAGIPGTCTAVQTRDITITDCIGCGECVVFESVEILGQRECEAEFLMNWGRLDGCGEITIISQTWDFGHVGGTGSGEIVTHVFPGNGTYTVTATIVYSVAGRPGVCTAVQTRDITITDCIGCGECVVFESIEILGQRECEAEFLMNWGRLDGCGEITIISQTWDFGYVGGTGSGEIVSHVFPGNGTYTVTATIVYSVAGRPGICTAIQTRDITITDCLSCEDCFNFFGIEIIRQSGCDAELVMDYAASGECGAISIISETWDFGHPGGTGTGYHTTHTFPGNGTYTVTATIVYSIAGRPGTCTSVQTRTVTITDCLTCEDCFNFFGIEVISQSRCTAELVMDYAGSGECGAITIISETWDFGYPGGTGTGYYTTHTFPGNGTYTVTATIVYSVAGLPGTCTSVQTRTITITDCLTCEDCFNFDGIIIDRQNRCEVDLVMDYAGTGLCGPISIISETWDFGHPGGTGSGLFVTHTFPGNGTYTVTATVVYSVPGIPGTCTSVQTRTITITGCVTCADCLNFSAIRVLSQNKCRVEFVMDYVTTGLCGPITIISETWNFGYPGGVGSGYYTFHNFPGNGTYNVTATIVFSVPGIAGTCTVVRTRTVTITGCSGILDGGGGRGQMDTPASETNALTVTTVPNPADEAVTITLIDPSKEVASENLMLTIFDMNGRIVYSTNVNVGVGENIELSKFNSGVYLYQISDENGVLIREKLIVQ
jgi:PKD repeat protein